MKSAASDCENSILTMIAAREGEKPLISVERAEAHLTVCADCRRELEQAEGVAGLLETQKRAAQPADLWTRIENRLETQARLTPSRKYQPFPVFGALLIVYKLLEMLPERDFGWSFKLVPIVFVVALFLFLKENPFKINSNLNFEK